jgi:hypothetical protein
MRRIDTCQVCGDPRVQLVSQGKCAKCLMRERREAQRRGEAVHNPQEYSLLRELNRYLSRCVKAVTAIEDGPLPEWFMSATDYQTVRRILRETIDRIQAEKKTTEHNAGVVPIPDVDDEQSTEAPEQGEQELQDEEQDVSEGPKLTIVNSTSEVTVNSEELEQEKDDQS